MRVRVSFEVEIPVTNATIEQATEWVEYELNAIGGISGSNPLCMTDIDNPENIIIDEI